MDPNANLNTLRSVAQEIIEAYEDEESNGVDQDDANTLAEHVLALDEWITKGGFLPDEWNRDGGATTLIRKVKADLPEYKNIIWSHARYGSYVEVYWRKVDADDGEAPRIEVNLGKSCEDVESAKILATLLRAAASTAEQWKAAPPWNTKLFQ